MKRILVFALVFIIGISSINAQNINAQKFKLAESYEKSGDFDSAIRLYTELMKSDPNNNDYFDSYARSLKAVNKYAELLPEVKQRFEKQKTIKTGALLGELYWRTGKISDANDVWDETITGFKTSTDVYVAIAQTAVTLQKYDKAVSVLILGRENLNNSKLFSDLLGRLYVATGDYVKGTDEILTQLKIDFNVAAAQGKLYALATNEESKQYIKNQLKSAASKFSDEIVFYELYSWFLRNIGDYETALTAIQKIDEFKKVQGADIWRFAEDSRRDGQLDIALKAYGVIIDMGKTNPYIHSALFGYARTLEEKMLTKSKISDKDAETIIEKYEGIIKDFPGQTSAVESRFRIATIYNKILKDNDKAIDELVILMKERSNPTISAQAGLLLASIYLEENQLDKSQKTLSEVLQKFRNQVPTETAKAEYSLAELLYFQGVTDSAMVKFKELSMLANNDVANDALNRVSLIETNKQYTRALVLFAEAELKQRQNRADDAVQSYMAVIELADGSDIAELAFKEIGEIYAEKGDYIAAKKQLEDFMNKFPDSIYGDAAIMKLADIYINEKNIDKAIESYTNLLVKYPKSIYLQTARKTIKLLREEKLRKQS